MEKAMCDNCGICMSRDYCNECSTYLCECSCERILSREEFFAINGLKPHLWDRILKSIPGEGFMEFYLELRGIGNAFYFDKNAKDKLVQWMKLTEELFL